MELDFKVLVDLSGIRNEERRKVSTWANFSRLHLWSSPGWWPGKSVDVTFVTVSALTPTIFVRISLQNVTKSMEIYTFRRRASCGDMGSGDMVGAILRSSHDDSRVLQKVEAPSRA